MKTTLKERRNAAICKRVNELCGTGMSVMQIYTQVGEEFWLEGTTIKQIYHKYTHYS